jgi:hypothetical protein
MAEGAAITPDVAVVQAELDKFQALGLTHEQLEVVIKDYVELVNASKAGPPRAEDHAPEPKPTTKKPSNDKIKSELLDMFPDLQDLSSVKDKLKVIESHVTEGARDTFRDANLKAEEHILTFLTGELNVDAGTKEGQKFIEMVGELVADATYGRENLLHRLAKGDSRVVKEVLKEFKDKGVFDSMKVPTKKEPKVLPFQSPRNSPFKETAAQLQEHLKTLRPQQRLRAIGAAVYDQVFTKKED